MSRVNDSECVMQYKFLVDGTWQVDEEQLRVIDGHGVINNLIFVEEPSLNAQTLPSEAVRGTLDLDSIRNMQLEVTANTTNFFSLHILC